MYRFNKSIWFCLFVMTAYAHAQNTFPSTGNVGIGTTTPQATLDVRGAISGGNADSTSGSVILQGHYGSGALSVWGTEESSGAPIMGYAVNPSGTGSFLSATSVSTPRAALVVGDSVGGVGSGMITFYAGPTQTTAIGSSVTMSPTMTITNSGNIGLGTTSPAYRLDVTGQIHSTSGLVYPDGTAQTTAWTGVLCGGDYAEAVEAAGGKKLYEPGDVLVLTSGDDSDVQKSSDPYSTMVAGIFATKPGVVGKREALTKADDNLPMAMVGIVPTKVTAESGPIRKGDLLVTSSKPGYAMKGTDRSRLVGAVIGKAMGSLQSGTGVIEVLVTLQ